MRSKIKQGLKFLRKTYDSEEILLIADLAESVERASPAQLSADEVAELRAWAERTAHKPTSPRAQWVAQMTLRILRENYNLKVKNK